jgi:hypothetical protein
MQAPRLFGLAARVLRHVDHLGQHFAVHGAGRLGVVGDLAEEGREAVRRVAVLLPDRLEVDEHALERLGGHFAQQLWLRLEVVEERLLRDVGPLADLGDGRGDALLLEERARGPRMRSRSSFRGARGGSCALATIGTP